MESYARYFLLVACEIISWASKKTLIFKTGDNRTFVLLLKVIGLYYLQVLIHVKFIFLFYSQWCVFHISGFCCLVSFGFVAFVAPFFPLQKLWDILGNLVITHWFPSTNVNRQLLQACRNKFDRLEKLDQQMKQNFQKRKWTPQQMHKPQLP